MTYRVTRLYQAFLAVLVVNVAACGNDPQGQTSTVSQCVVDGSNTCSAAGTTGGSSSTSTIKATGGEKPASSTTGGNTGVVSTATVAGTSSVNTSAGGSSSNATGGNIGVAGTSTTGGSTAVVATTTTVVQTTGGNSTTGGATASGSTTSTTGGSSSTGGSSTTVQATGGKSSTGGSSANATGGSNATGGTGSASSTSTTSATGGSATTTGGNSSTGGTTSTAIECNGLYAGCQSDTDCCAGLYCTFDMSRTCQKIVSGTGGSASTGGSSSVGSATSTGGVGSTSGTGGTGSTGSVTSTGGSPSLVCGTATSAATLSYTGSVNVTRDSAFDAMNTASGNMMAITQDTWCSSSSDCYSVTADMGSSRWATHGDGSVWSVIDNLPVPSDILPSTSLAPSSVTGSSSTKVVIGASVMTSSYGNNSTMFFFKQGTSWTPERLPLNLTSGMEGQPKSMWTDGRYLFAVLVNNESTQWQYDYEIVLLDMLNDSWSKFALPSHELPFELRHIWGLTACNVYAVGAENGHAVMFHFDGVAWSRVTTIPSDIVELNSVHGNANDVVVVGTVPDTSTTAHAVFLSSSGSSLLKSWNRKDGAVDISAGGDAVWSAGKGVALFGANANPDSPSAASISVLVGNTWSGSLAVGQDAGYIRAIWGDVSSGNAVLGTDGTTPTGSIAGIYRVSVQ